MTPHPPLRPASVYPPPLLRGEDTLAGWRGGWGVNILEDARHRIVNVLYLYRILFAPDQNVKYTPFRINKEAEFTKRTISFRFLGIILRVLRLEVSVYNVFTTNELQTTFARRGGGGVITINVPLFN